LPQANLLDLTEPLRLNEGHLQAHDSVKLHRELMKYYRKLCRDALVLEVTYQDDEGRLIPMEIDPFEVIQQDTRLYLLGVDRRVSQKIKLNLEKIHHVRQLPSKVENRLQPIKVVFALTGRVAKTYRPYPDELILESHDDHIVVQAKTCEHTPLLQRLLKYNIHCEVLAPSYVRQEMRQKIQALRAGLIRSQVSKG
jgi:predicted DNA-binding transcriptional regulator YafY